MANDINWYRQQIVKAIEQDGPYSHNIVSSVLRSVSNEFGANVANGLIDEYELDEVFGIQKVNDSRGLSK